MIVADRLNVYRMADLLWDHYTRAGLIFFVEVTFTKDMTRFYYYRALRNTALHTYLQYCKDHNLSTGYIKGLL